MTMISQGPPFFFLQSFEADCFLEVEKLEKDQAMHT